MKKIAVKVKRCRGVGGGKRARMKRRRSTRRREWKKNEKKHTHTGRSKKRERSQ